MPQFRFVLEPMLLAVAASVALVCARIWIGRGGALGAAAFFIAVRGAIALIVGIRSSARRLPHLPLYLAEAACVELAGLALARRPLALGAASGVADRDGRVRRGVGLVASSRCRSRGPRIFFPEALIGAIVAATAGGLIGALVGCALQGRLPRAQIARTVTIVALLAIMGVFVDGLWTSGPRSIQANVTLHNVRAGPQREVSATVRIDPPQAAKDPAWLNATAWQGGGLVIDKLAPAGNGVYRTTDPIPVWGDWKATIRLQRGRQILGLPIYMPNDAAIPWAPGVAAKRHFTRSFVADHEVLQREQKPGVPGWLKTAAPLVVLALALGFVASLAWGLGRVARRTGEPPPPPRREPAPRLRATSVPTGARP